jgi:hypothetical protein
MAFGIDSDIRRGQSLDDVIWKVHLTPALSRRERELRSVDG